MPNLHFHADAGGLRRPRLFAGLLLLGLKKKKGARRGGLRGAKPADESLPVQELMRSGSREERAVDLGRQPDFPMSTTTKELCLQCMLPAGVTGCGLPECPSGMAAVAPEKKLGAAPAGGLLLEVESPKERLCGEVRALAGEIRKRLQALRGLAPSEELDEAGVLLLELTAGINRAQHAEAFRAGWSGPAARPGDRVVPTNPVPFNRAAGTPAGYPDRRSAAAGDRLDNTAETLEERRAA